MQLLITGCRREFLLIISGWIDDFGSEGTRLVTESYIKRNDHNIIVLDWGQYSFTWLPPAVIRSSIISKLAGKSLTDLFLHGLDANKFHCVGHSIGGMYVHSVPDISIFHVIWQNLLWWSRCEIWYGNGWCGGACWVLLVTRECWGKQLKWKWGNIIFSFMLVKEQVTLALSCFSF